jgi:hypothetical protein
VSADAAPARRCSCCLRLQSVDGREQDRAAAQCTSATIRLRRHGWRQGGRYDAARLRTGRRIYGEAPALCVMTGGEPLLQATPADRGLPRRGFEWRGDQRHPGGARRSRLDLRQPQGGTQIVQRAATSSSWSGPQPAIDPAGCSNGIPPLHRAADGRAGREAALAPPPSPWSWPTRAGGSGPDSQADRAALKRAGRFSGCGSAPGSRPGIAGARVP